MTVLNAVFSLGASPPGFNFLYFLVAADVERERRGLEHLNVIVTPGPADGFRAADTEYSVAEKLFRLRHLVLPGAWLLPSVVGVQFIPGEIAPDLVDRWGKMTVWPGLDGFPAVSGPTLINDAVAEGFDVRRLRASEWARNLCTVSKTTAEKLVTITLREAHYDTHRNSNATEWEKFARWLADGCGYRVLVLHDSERPGRVYDPKRGIYCADFAANNIDLRAALYEAAWLNMGINHGVQELWLHLERCNYLMCWIGKRMGRPNSTPEGRPWESVGRRSWNGEDTFEELVENFERIEAELS